MRVSRLRLRGRVGLACWFLVRDLLGQNPVRRLCQMSGDGTDRFGMIFAVAHPRIETTYVSVLPVRSLSMRAARLGSFCEGPFQVMVHVGPGASEAGLAPTRVNARSRAGVRGKAL